MPQLDTTTYLSQVFWLLITFFSLWFAMSWFIIPRIEEILEQRRLKIDSYIQKAEKINNQALQSLDKYEQALAKAKNEAEARIVQNKAELEKNLAAQKSEMEELLNRKIAENEFILAKERQETLAAIHQVSLKLAADILEKLAFKDIPASRLKQAAIKEDKEHG